MALKKCFKLHKLFLSELERCERMDREAAQVLSSLANVGKRLPLLSDASASFGVLSFQSETPSLLLEKHFLAMEKSAAFLKDIVKDLVDAMRRLRGFVDELVDLVDDAFASDEGELASAKAATAALQTLEWMENVRTMQERDTLRKRLLVAELEYHDVARLQRMHSEWPVSSAASFVDTNYVRRGTEVLPPLPVVEQTAADDNSVEPARIKKKSKQKQAK